MNAKGFLRFHLTREMLVRILADTIMSNAAVLVALALRYIYLVGFEAPHGVDYCKILSKYLLTYRNTGWFITLICAVVFYLSGFFCRGGVPPKGSS